jgi:hypothetical protein
MKSIYKAVSASVFLLASGLSFAGEPINLNAEDMDQVNAGLTISVGSSSTGYAAGFNSASQSISSTNILGLVTFDAGSLATSPLGSVYTTSYAGGSVTF